MSEQAGDILSGEELEAILRSFEAVAASSPEKPASIKSVRQANQWRSSPLGRALREYGEDHARSLSTVYQRPLAFTLISLESAPAGDFAESMLDTDLPALIEFLPRGVMGSLLVGRTLLYSWLGMAYGGPASSPVFVPARAYTAIEVRFLRRCVEQLVAVLGTGLGITPAPTVRVVDFLEPSLLPDQTAPRLRVASFEAKGFGELARLRIAIPDELCPDAAARRSPGAASTRSDLGTQLLEVPVRIHAEIGWSDVGLRAVSHFAPGDVIELESRPGGEVIVCLEGEAKFHGQRGRSGERSAVRITEKL